MANLQNGDTIDDFNMDVDVLMDADGVINKNDPIREYLEAELLEIKTESLAVQEQINRRNKLLNTWIEDNKQKNINNQENGQNEGALRIAETWKRTVGQRFFIYGISVEKDTSNSSDTYSEFIKNIDVVLTPKNSSCKDVIKYKVEIYNNDNEDAFPSEPCFAFKRKAIILLTIERPLFLIKKKNAAKNFELKACIFYNYNDNNTTVNQSNQLLIPLFSIELSDFTKSALEITNDSLLSADWRNFFCLFSVRKRAFFKFNLKNEDDEVEKLLEIYAMLRKISPNYFLIDNISSNLNGVILTPTKESQMIIYYEDNKQLQLIINYLKENVPQLELTLNDKCNNRRNAEDIDKSLENALNKLRKINNKEEENNGYKELSEMFVEILNEIEIVENNDLN